jgi:hypothetical protein
METDDQTARRLIESVNWRRVVADEMRRNADRAIDRIVVENEAWERRTRRTDLVIAAFFACVIVLIMVFG